MRFCPPITGEPKGVQRPLNEMEQFYASITRQFLRWGAGSLESTWRAMEKAAVESSLSKRRLSIALKRKRYVSEPQLFSWNSSSRCQLTVFSVFYCFLGFLLRSANKVFVRFVRFVVCFREFAFDYARPHSPCERTSFSMLNFPFFIHFIRFWHYFHRKTHFRVKFFDKKTSAAQISHTFAPI